jgi:hypothetical protein
MKDLGPCTAYNFASPEQRPVELHRSTTSPYREFLTPTPTTNLNGSNDYNYHTSKISSQYESRHEDQLSTSPLPFLYSTYPAPDVNIYSPYMTTHPPYHSIAATTHTDYTLYPLYHFSHISSAYPNTLPSFVHPDESEYNHEEDITQFSMRYATIVGIETSVLYSPYKDSESDVKQLPLKRDSAH